MMTREQIELLVEKKVKEVLLELLGRPEGLTLYSPRPCWITTWARISQYMDCSIGAARYAKELYGAPIVKLLGGRVAAIPELLDWWLINNSERARKTGPRPPNRGKGRKNSSR